MRVAQVLACSMFLAACAAGSPTVPAGGPAEGTDGPLLGAADGLDSADRACDVVLRSLRRPSNTTGGYQTECVPGGSCWLVWAGALDVSLDALAAGAEPAVLYSLGSRSQWWEVSAVPADGAGPGFQRFSFRFFDHTVAEGVSTTSFSRTVLAVAPFVRTPDGARHFDHNRNPGDFDDYALSSSNGWSVPEAPAVCPASEPVASVALLALRAGWTTEQHGALVAGGTAVVDYALERLPECRNTHNGYPAWDLVAHARFAPSGEEQSGSVRGFEYVGGTPTSAAHSVPFTLSIPRGATSVELWFENRSGAGSTCVTWDSNLGANYRFDILAAPPAAVGWAGNVGGSFDRACAHTSGLAEPVTVDSYSRERACMFVDADVWVPGLTDAGARPELVYAQAVWAFDGGAPQSEWLTFVERTGNDFRYRFALPRERMTREAWSTLAYSLRFSTDGVTWSRVGQSDGPDGGADRTIVRGATF
jgi:hypothetical protein